MLRAGTSRCEENILKLEEMWHFPHLIGTGQSCWDEEMFQVISLLLHGLGQERFPLPTAASKLFFGEV